jgi:hypothetical protein
LARPKKIGVDYFPHDVTASSSRTIFTLESKFGNDGYAFWFKLLEIIGSQENLYYDCRNPSNWLFLLAKTHVSEVSATEILETLSQVDAIDTDLWYQKVIWIQKFSERLSVVYGKRGTETPLKPSFCDGNPTSSDVSVTESTQSKVKESKVKESKEKDIEKKHKYGEYKNILLTDNEIEKLKAKFTDWEVHIETLSQGIELKGYVYKSHYLAILKWVEKDNSQSKNKHPDYSDPNRYKETEGDPFGNNT